MALLIAFAAKDVAAFTDKTVSVDSSGELVSLGRTGEMNAGNTVYEMDPRHRLDTDMLTNRQPHPGYFLTRAGA